MPTSFHSPGTAVAWRTVRDGAVLHAVPMTVVEDGPEQTVLFTEIGARFRRMEAPEGPTRDIFRATVQREATWQSNRALHIVRPGEPWSIQAFWLGHHERFLGWYINLQDPMQRAAVGFDGGDRELDILLHANLRDWSWKDEDELQAAVRFGRFTEAEAASFYEDGRRVLDLANRGAAPFRDGWDQWRPNPEWPIPELPPGWDRP